MMDEVLNFKLKGKLHLWLGSLGIVAKIGHNLLFILI